MNDRNRALAFASMLMLMLPIGAARAQPVGPWLPPAVRSAPLAAETRGAALQRQVLAKLEAQFQQADAAGRGAVTRAQAQQAGWGFAVQHFAELDTENRGEIRVADLRAFIERRAAR